MISTKLYNDQSIDRFKAITGDIQQTQAKIATGRNVLKASDDPVAAANIAFTKDQKVVLERYATNIQRADQRLSLVETMLGDATNILTRVYELSIQASNDTYSASDRKAIGAEVTQLKDALLGLANAKDEAGKFLFSGFKVGQMPFVANADGSLEYKGDRGVHSVQVSESMKMNTGIDGAAVFLRADAGGNATSVFKVLETLEKNLNANELNRPEIAVNFKANGVKAEGSETMQIDLVGAASGTDDDLSFTTAALTAGDDTEIITAIKTAFDALADKKGYSASIENDVITFTRSDGSNFSFEATETGTVGTTAISLEASLDDGPKNDLRSGVATVESNAAAAIANVKSVLEHMGVQRTTVGAELNKGEVQQRVIENRLLLMTENISAMEDADLAALVTDLQSQIVNRDAAQQAFVKIGQQSLFDYIR